MPAHRRTFLKTLGLSAAGLTLTNLIPDCIAAQPMIRRRFPRSTPEAQGVSSAEILQFLDAVSKSEHEFHSFMMVRHGHVIAEGWWSPYASELNHMLYSLSKSFTSTAVGFAVTEGRLKIDDFVISFFPEDLPEHVSENLAALKVKHLLTMSAGHSEASSPGIRNGDNWVRNFLALPIENPPGSVFLYDSGETYILSAILQKITGQKVIDYLTPRFFRPLDIRGMTWEVCPRGINTGGWGLSVQTETIAKFGQFYLQKGAWNGKQILPASWIEEATSFKIQQPAAANSSQDLETLKKTSEWHQGYGYQFWRTRHNAFRADGAFGQYSIVMPEQDAVIAITGETASMPGEFELLWKYLLPAIKRDVLPPDKDAQAQLQRALASLALTPPKAQPTSSITAKISGSEFNIDGPTPRSVRFQFKPHSCTFTLCDEKGEHHVTCGIENWIKGETDMPGTPPKLTPVKLGEISKVAASGTWHTEDTFLMTWQFIETPHHDTVTCHFANGEVTITFLGSVTEKMPSHKEERQPLHGRLRTS